MRSLVDGRECGVLELADRGLQYGDGLFETIAIRHGRPRLVELHLERLRQGCRRIGLQMPDAALLRQEIAAVSGAGSQVVKLIVTRGTSGRGYRPPPDAVPTRIVAAYPGTPRRHGAVRIRTCRTRLGASPALAGLKHLGRLEQVLARAEWQDEEVAEGLMLDGSGYAMCGTQTNLFVLRAGELLTPPVDQGGVAGVMRRAVLRWARGRCMVAREAALPAGELRGADEVFLTNALVGAWPVAELDGQPLRRGQVAGEFNEWLEDV